MSKAFGKGNATQGVGQFGGKKGMAKMPMGNPTQGASQFGKGGKTPKK